MSLKLTRSEREHVRQMARTSGLAASAYVRRSALAGRPPAPSPGRLTREGFRQLQGVARNLNQITARVNASHKGTLPAELIPNTAEIEAITRRVLAWIEAHEE